MNAEQEYDIHDKHMKRSPGFRGREKVSHDQMASVSALADSVPVFHHVAVIAIFVCLRLIDYLFILAGVSTSWPGKTDTIVIAEFPVLAVAVEHIPIAFTPTTVRVPTAARLVS